MQRCSLWLITSYHPRQEGKLLVTSKPTLQDMGSLIKSFQTTVHHFHPLSSKSLHALTHLITWRAHLPTHSSNAENAVNTTQKLMRKAFETCSAPYLALLYWQNTPSESINTSAAQRLFGHRTKTLLPTSTQLLKPQVPDNIEQKLKQQKTKQTFYYNCGTKELQGFHLGETVCITPPKIQATERPGQKQKLKDKSTYNRTKYIQKMSRYSVKTGDNFGWLKKKWSQRLTDHIHLHLSKNQESRQQKGLDKSRSWNTSRHTITQSMYRRWEDIP